MIFQELKSSLISDNASLEAEPLLSHNLEQVSNRYLGLLTIIQGQDTSGVQLRFYK